MGVLIVKTFSKENRQKTSGEAGAQWCLVQYQMLLINQARRIRHFTESFLSILQTSLFFDTTNVLLPRGSCYLSLFFVCMPLSLSPSLPLSQVFSFSWSRWRHLHRSVWVVGFWFPQSQVRVSTLKGLKTSLTLSSNTAHFPSDLNFWGNWHVFPTYFFKFKNWFTIHLSVPPLLVLIPLVTNFNFS